MGRVEDKTTQMPLPHRTVAVQGTTRTDMTDADGRFALSGVTIGTITLTVTDRAGASDGITSVDLANFTGSTRSVGVILLDRSKVSPLRTL